MEEPDENMFIGSPIVIKDSDDEDDLLSGATNKFIPCKYHEYCNTLVDEPELLIDDLYCSLACKNRDKKQTVPEEEHFIDETVNETQKTTVNLNQIFTKLDNRINKRKQLLKTSCTERAVEENYNRKELSMILCCEPSKEENEAPLNSLMPISSSEKIDNDDNNYFDLEVYFYT